MTHILPRFDVEDSPGDLDIPHEFLTTIEEDPDPNSDTTRENVPDPNAATTTKNAHDSEPEKRWQDFCFDPAASDPAATEFVAPQTSAAEPQQPVPAQQPKEDNAATEAMTPKPISREPFPAEAPSPVDAPIEASAADILLVDPSVTEPAVTRPTLTESPALEHMTTQPIPSKPTSESTTEPESSCENPTFKFMEVRRETGLYGAVVEYLKEINPSKLLVVVENKKEVSDLGTTLKVNLPDRRIIASYGGMSPTRESKVQAVLSELGGIPIVASFLTPIHCRVPDLQKVLFVGLPSSLDQFHAGFSYISHPGGSTTITTIFEFRDPSNITDLRKYEDFYRRQGTIMTRYAPIHPQANGPDTHLAPTRLASSQRPPQTYSVQPGHNSAYPNRGDHTPRPARHYGRETPPTGFNHHGRPEGFDRLVTGWRNFATVEFWRVTHPPRRFNVRVTRWRDFAHTEYLRVINVA